MHVVVMTLKNATNSHVVVLNEHPTTFKTRSRNSPLTGTTVRHHNYEKNVLESTLCRRQRSETCNKTIIELQKHKLEVRRMSSRPVLSTVSFFKG